MTPPLIFSKVINTLSTVVFPEPDGPMIETISFFLMIRRPPRSTPKPSSAASDVYKRQVINREIVEFIRSTPLLIQLFFVYFVLPQFGIKLSAWLCGMITIGLHFGTYLSEVYRGALEGVSKTQWEAC